MAPSSSSPSQLRSPIPSALPGREPASSCVLQAWRRYPPADPRGAARRALVRAALAEAAPGPAHAELVAWLLPLFEAAIRTTLHEPARPRLVDRMAARERDGLEHEILAALLERKLLDPGRQFLRHLARALTPDGYAADSARHFAVDFLKRRGPGREVRLPAVFEQLEADPRPVGGGLVEDLLAERERFSRLWGVLLEATEDERTLLRFAFLSADEVPVEDLERVARARGVSPAEVLEELATAGLRRRESSLWQLRRHEACGCQAMQLHARIARLGARIAELGEGREGSERRLEEAVLRRLEGNPAAFRGAGHELRAACVAVLEARLERLEGRRQALAEERRRGWDRPRRSYRDLARVLGLLGPDAPPEERRRVENTLTRRLERLIARLRRRAGEKGLGRVGRARIR